MKVLHVRFKVLDVRFKVLDVRLKVLHVRLNVLHIRFNFVTFRVPYDLLCARSIAVVAAVTRQTRTRYRFPFFFRILVPSSIV